MTPSGWGGYSPQDFGIGPDDDCGPDVVELSARTVTARVAHGCDLCEGSVLPGERYHRHTLTEDGVFMVRRWHEDNALCRRRADEVEEARTLAYRAGEEVYDDSGRHWSPRPQPQPFDEADLPF